LTNLLYRQNPYMKEFDATIIRLEAYIVVLDRTYFFPQGGGQVGDTGDISTIRVINTLMEGEEVHHILETPPPFSTGQRVQGKIDWERRYRIMRLHSAAHLVYYAMREVFGKECKPASSGLLDDRKDRSDYLFDEPLDKEKLVKVEIRVNQLISKGLPITHSFDESLGKILWKVEPFETMACGGTHVRNTSEIGRIQVKRGSKPGRGKERIELTLV
jgi:alanyl-tRNA synthetase